MTQTEAEHWVCKENVARFQLALLEPSDQATCLQLTDLLSREMLKLQTMFPDQE